MCVRHPHVAPQVATLEAELCSFIRDVRGAVNLADLGTRFPKARLKSAGYPSHKAFVAAFPELVTVEQRNDGEIWLRQRSAVDEEVCRPAGVMQALPQSALCMPRVPVCAKMDNQRGRTRDT